jgi:hypothetical protein
MTLEGHVGPAVRRAVNSVARRNSVILPAAPSWSGILNRIAIGMMSG